MTTLTAVTTSLKANTVQLSSLPRSAMAIDQAIDGTGVAFIFANVPLADVELVTGFARVSLCQMDERFVERQDEIISALRQAYASKTNTSLTLPPVGRERLPKGFGLVGPSPSGGLNIFIHMKLANAPTNVPEWITCDRIAKQTRVLSSRFLDVAKMFPGELPLVTMESLILGGLSGSKAISSILACLWFSIWREFESAPETKGFLKEWPIKKWKITFTSMVQGGEGNPKAQKKDVKELVYSLGFGRIEGDDESDAMAMALASGFSSLTGALPKDSGGRALPTSSQRKETAERKRQSKERKADQTKLKAEKKAEKDSKQQAKLAVTEQKMREKAGEKAGKAA